MRYIEKILGKEGLRNLGFDVLIGGKLTARWTIKLDRIEEEVPSMSDVLMPVDRADDIELKEIMKNAARSMEDFIAQLEGESSKDLPMHELLGLDKQLRSIRGSLKVEVAKGE